MSNVYRALAELTEHKGTITEQDVWDAIRETYGLDGYIEDGDITEWL